MARLLHRRTPTRFFLLVTLLVVMPVLSIAFGTAPVPIGQVLGVLADHCDIPIHVTWDSITDAIVWQNRMPRIVTGLGVSATLGVAGVALQAVVRNPLAEPYVLGVSAGASSGAAAAIIIVGVTSSFAVAGMAFLGALLSTAIVLFMGGGRNSSTLRLVLAGLAVGFIFQAVTNFIIFSSDSAETARAVMFWTLGDLSRASWGQGWTNVVVAIVLTVLLWACAPWLDALASGDSIPRPPRSGSTRPSSVCCFSSPYRLGWPWRWLSPAASVSSDWSSPTSCDPSSVMVTVGWWSPRLWPEPSS